MSHEPGEASTGLQLPSRHSSHPLCQAALFSQLKAENLRSGQNPFLRKHK